MSELGVRSTATAARPIAGARLALLGAGPIVAFLVAWGTSSVGGGPALVNVALVLAIEVTGVGLGDALAGALTSVVAALALNYFHTEPVHTLRVTGGDDLLAVVLLGALGVGVSVITAVRVRRAAVDQGRATASDASVELARGLIVGRPITELWTLAMRATSGPLGLVDCRLVDTGRAQTPVIARHRRPIDGDPDHRLLLPQGGASAMFRDPRHAAHLVLTPRPGLGAIEVDRRAVLNFVDELELALWSASAFG